MDHNLHISQLSTLKTAKIAGVKAPHKPILLLSIIDLIERGVITNSHIELSEALERQFALNWARYVGNAVLFQAKIATPFWHLQNEPFWRLVRQNGDIVDVSDTKPIYSVSKLKKEMQYAEIDRELFIMMQSEDNRAKFRTLLISTYLSDKHLLTSDIAPMIITISTTILSVAS